MNKSKSKEVWGDYVRKKFLKTDQNFNKKFLKTDE